MTTTTPKTTPMPIEPVAQLSLGTKVLYGIGDIASSIKLVTFGLFTLFFYTSVMGLSGTLVGLATTVGLVWDAVIDPYLGYFSDRIRSRWGRRHGLMLAGSLTMGAGLWFYFSPPQGLSSTQLFLWLLIGTIWVRTATSIFSVPYFALGAELSSDYHERTKITSIRTVLAMLGTLMAAGLTFIVFFPNQQSGIDPKLDYAGYPPMGLTFGIVMTVTGLIATFGTFGHGDSDKAQPTTAPTPKNFFTDSLEALQIRSFRIMFSSFSLFYLAIVVNSALSIHYLTYYAEITDSAVLSSFQVAFYVGGIAGALLWLFLSRRIEKRWLYIAGGLLTAAIMAAASLLIGEGTLLGTGNVQALRIGHALGGVFGSIVWIIPWSMMADIIDDDELQNGVRRQGTLFGIFFFGQQVAAGASVLLTGLLVDWFAGLVPGQVEQSALTAQRIGNLFGYLPAILIAIAIVLAIRYPLTLDRVKAIQTALNRRHGRIDSHE